MEKSAMHSGYIREVESVGFGDGVDVAGEGGGNQG